MVHLNGTCLLRVVQGRPAHLHTGLDHAPLESHELLRRPSHAPLGQGGGAVQSSPSSPSSPPSSCCSCSCCSPPFSSPSHVAATVKGRTSATNNAAVRRRYWRRAVDSAMSSPRANRSSGPTLTETYQLCKRSGVLTRTLFDDSGVAIADDPGTVPHNQDGPLLVGVKAIDTALTCGSVRGRP